MGEQANHFTVAGDGIEGGLDTTSIAGVPVGSITVDGHEGSNFADGPGTAALVLLPQTYVDGDSAEIEGLVIVTTSADSIGGPALVDGPVQRYAVRAVCGTASAVQS